MSNILQMGFGSAVTRLTSDQSDRGSLQIEKINKSQKINRFTFDPASKNKNR